MPSQNNRVESHSSHGKCSYLHWDTVCLCGVNGILHKIVYIYQAKKSILCQEIDSITVHLKKAEKNGSITNCSKHPFSTKLMYINQNKCVNECMLKK